MTKFKHVIQGLNTENVKYTLSITHHNEERKIMENTDNTADVFFISENDWKIFSAAYNYMFKIVTK